MALWVCGGEAGCGTKYAVGLFRCPRCHNTEFFEDGEDPMGKISRHAGASVAAPDTAADDAPEAHPGEGESVPSQTAVREHSGTGVPMTAVEGDELIGDGSGEALPPVPDEEYGPDAIPLEGGEESSPGSSSSASTETQPTNSEPSSKTRPRRARKTASPSEKDQTESGSAPSTDGEKTDGTSTPDVSE